MTRVQGRHHDRYLERLPSTIAWSTPCSTSPTGWPLFRPIVGVSPGSISTFSGVVQDSGRTSHSPGMMAGTRLHCGICEIGRQPQSQDRSTNLVHADFRHGNVLVDASGTVAGAVHWKGVGRGVLRFGPVTPTSDFGWGARFSTRYASPLRDTLYRISQGLVSMNEDQLRPYWTYMSLERVNRPIRHHSPEVVDHNLHFSPSRMITA